tara:strand:+ start:110 stop:580 length:471 start_codon:yes stop_codon:yes gene_type:complete
MLLKLLFFFISLTNFCSVGANDYILLNNNSTVYLSNNFTYNLTLSPVFIPSHNPTNISYIIVNSEKSNISESTSILLGVSIPIVFIIFAFVIYYLYRSYSEIVYIETNEFMRNPMYDTDNGSVEDLEDTYLELSPGEEDIYDEIYHDDSISSDDNM